MLVFNCYETKMGIRAGQGLPKASVVANCNSNIRSGKAEKSLPIFTSVWFFLGYSYPLVYNILLPPFSV
jgi:hypothetical protein